MNHPMGARPPVRYLAVELGHEGIAEWGERRHAVFVPRDEIVDIEVRSGIAGGRAALQVLIGLLLVAGGVFLTGALAGLLDAGFSRGSAPLTGASVPLVLLGGYVVWFALHPALYLCIRARRGKRRVFFHGEADLASLAETLRDAKRRFGYSVRWSIPEPRIPHTPYRAVDES